MPRYIMNMEASHSVSGGVDKLPEGGEATEFRKKVHGEAGRSVFDVHVAC